MNTVLNFEIFFYFQGQIFIFRCILFLSIGKVMGQKKNDIYYYYYFFFFNRHCSGTSNPQLGGPVIRMFQLLPQGFPHA